MTVRVALNGFGRIGRCVLRAAWDDPEIEFVHINDLTNDEVLAHLLSYDTVHGRFEGVEVVDGGIQVRGKFIATSAERDPSNLPWKERNVDVVLECTGAFRKRADAARHLDAGAGRVIISAPGTDPDLTVVMGVNDHLLQADHSTRSNLLLKQRTLRAASASVLMQCLGGRTQRAASACAFMQCAQRAASASVLMQCPQRAQVPNTRATARNCKRCCEVWRH